MYIMLTYYTNVHLFLLYNHADSAHIISLDSLVINGTIDTDVNNTVDPLLFFLIQNFVACIFPMY